MGELQTPLLGQGARPDLGHHPPILVSYDMDSGVLRGYMQGTYSLRNMLGVGEDVSQSEDKLGSQVGQVGPGLVMLSASPTAPVPSSPAGGTRGETGANQRGGDMLRYARCQIPR